MKNKTVTEAPQPITIPKTERDMDTLVQSLVLSHHTLEQIIAKIYAQKWEQSVLEQFLHKYTISSVTQIGQAS